MKTTMELIKLIPLLFEGKVTKIQYEEDQNEEVQFSEVITVVDGVLELRTVEGYYIHSQSFLVSDFHIGWSFETDPDVTRSELVAPPPEEYKLLTHLHLLLRGEVEFLVAKDKDDEDIYLYLGEEQEPLPGMDEVEISLDFMFEDEDGHFQVFAPDLTKQLFTYDWKPVKGVKG